MNGNTSNERILKRYLTEQDKERTNNNSNGEEDEKEVVHGLINQAVVNRLIKFIVKSLERDEDAYQTSKKKEESSSSSLQRVTLSLKRRLTLQTSDRDNKNKRHDTDNDEGFGSNGEITKLCSKAIVKLLTSNIDRPNKGRPEGPKIDEHLLRLVQNQRSMYLIGSRIQFPSSSLYTNTRFQQHNTSRFQSLYNTDVPMIDSKALTHLKPIILNYIKSDTCYEQLKPIVQNQFMSNQPTEIAASHLLVHTLAPLIQPTLNTIIKNSVIQFLNNTNIRQMTKQRIINTTSAVAGNTNPPTVLVSSVQSTELNKTDIDNEREIISTTQDNQETRTTTKTTTRDKTTSSGIDSTTTDTKDKILRRTSTKQLKNDDEDKDTDNEDEIEPPEFI